MEMREIFSSIRRSLAFPSSTEDDGGMLKGIKSTVRRSRAGFLHKYPPQLPSPVPPPRLPPDDTAPIRWRKGEVIGCGAYGRVYMGMNLDSGELLAVKQVLIGANKGSKEKAQAHIQELEDEVKLLKNLSHKNIVRYLGTAREEEALNILMEFVPGGSISSLLGKFGPFPQPVLRMYTKQLLQGLEYLHRKGVIHRDIKGANILVDNKGCIKLADFGASKQVVELATITGAKSMKGTPYWMAPEVILQTGHSFPADIWSVGCTVIEMATGKPPWSEKYQEVAALFYIGTTKSHPPIPEHLSLEAKDFLLKCLQTEPNSRPSASDLLQHPFVVGERQVVHSFGRSSVMEQSMNFLRQSGSFLRNSFNMENWQSTSSLHDVPNVGSVRSSTTYRNRTSRTSPFWQTRTSGDLCRLDDDLELCRRSTPSQQTSILRGFNPMSEPLDDWRVDCTKSSLPPKMSTIIAEGKKFGFPSEEAAYEDDEEVTESKISAFSDEKALELKKLQTPLYEEFYNTTNTVSPINDGTQCEAYVATWSLPPKNRSPRKMINRDSVVVEDVSVTSPGNCSRGSPSGGNHQSGSPLGEIPPSRMNEGNFPAPDGQHKLNLSRPSLGSTDRYPNGHEKQRYEQQRLWKEELDRELDRERERKKRTEPSAKNTVSPSDNAINRQRDRLGFITSP